MHPIILLSCLLPAIAEGSIGYDCGTRSLNVTTISALDVDNCDIPSNNLNVTTRYIQLLQLTKFVETPVIQCKIEIHRTVHRCGMFSHTSAVEYGSMEYIYEISHEQCKRVHETGILRYDNHVISGLRVNQTSTHPITYAGSLKNNGECSGASYTDPYGSWEGVVVQGTLKITLQQHTGAVDINNNIIQLRSGTRCTLTQLSCVDLEGGYTFWEAQPLDRCETWKYSVLYEGLARKIYDATPNSEQTIYTLNTEDITFTLVVKGKLNSCGYELLKTEHPKLLIFETSRKGILFTSKKASVDNLDLFAYVNSKFVFVEKHIKTQIKRLYEDVLLHRCEQERQTLKNALAIAAQSPDQFAYNLMKGPGYLAITAGEVIHVVKCTPVEVKVAHTEECYEELAVTRNNKTMFLTPKTHILKSRGTQTECNGLLPAYYQINENWYKLLPKVTESKNPTTLHPLTKTTWKYTDPASLATSGIYSENDLEKLRDRMLFPLEQTAIINNVAREMHGHSITDNEGIMSKLLDENTMAKIVENAWNSLWTKFVTFGSVSAGIFSIIIIIQGIKMILNILLKGYALHRIYGWSIHLFGALWGTLSTLILYLRERAEREEERRRQMMDENRRQRREAEEIHIPMLPQTENPPLSPSTSSQETQIAMTHVAPQVRRPVKEAALNF